MPRALILFLAVASLSEAQTQSRSSWLALSEEERARVEEHAAAYKAFMGVAKTDADWLPKFRPYTVTPEVMARVSGPDTVFLHDLPAMRGYEVLDEVLDGPQSIAFRQAYHKMTSAMAVLNWAIHG